VNPGKWKNWGVEAIKYLGALIIPIVVTAIIKGESLAGVAQLGRLLPLLQTGVPLWILLVLLVVLVWMIPVVIGAKRKVDGPKLYVSWERMSCVWALGKYGETPIMQISGQAVITSSGTEETILLLDGFVKGTSPIMNLIDTISVPPGKPIACRVVTMVKPVIKKANEDLDVQLIFLDHKGREYKANKVVFKSANPQEFSQKLAEDN
jgi:hypothetical protein